MRCVAFCTSTDWATQGLLLVQELRATRATSTRHEDRPDCQSKRPENDRHKTELNLALANLRASSGTFPAPSQTRRELPKPRSLRAQSATERASLLVLGHRARHLHRLVWPRSRACALVGVKAGARFHTAVRRGDGICDVRFLIPSMYDGIDDPSIGGCGGGGCCCRPSLPGGSRRPRGAALRSARGRDGLATGCSTL